jgi:predicted unusual protein kinase regulating ubiquinone biosynthesis (AarF/ABC1/UbiB family)
MVRTIFTHYYAKLGADSQKQIVSALLGSNLEATPIEHFMTALQNSGPQLQKLLQIVAIQSDLPTEMEKVLKQLEDGVRKVPTIQSGPIFAAEQANYDFRSIEENPLGVGSMAQVHSSELEGPGGTTLPAVARFIKPGMAERVEEDNRVLSEIANDILDRDPQYRATGSPRVGPLIEDLSNTVRAELSLPATIARQKQAVQVYEKSFNIKTRGRTLKISYHVPRVIPSKGPSQLHVQERVRGKKLDKALADVADAAEIKRLLAEKTADLFFHEVLVGSGFYHADLHQGNFLVDKVSDNEFVVNLLDYGMGGTLTRDMQEKLIVLSSALYLNKVKTIVDIFWEISNKDKNRIDRETFAKRVDEQVRNLRARNVVWSDSTWTTFAIDQGLALPYDFINMNRAFIIIGKMLERGGSKETAGSMATKAVLSHPFRALWILAVKGRFSLAELYRLQFSRAQVDSIGYISKMSPEELDKRDAALDKEKGPAESQALIPTVRPGAPVRCDAIYSR